MNNVYALIIGIDKYDQPTWEDIAGPCANALAVAEWCLAASVPPQNIFMFLDPLDNPPEENEKLREQIAQLKSKQVRICQSATLYAIDTYWRVELGKNRPPDSRLLVYWSGHAFTDNDGTRVLICRDYTNPQPRNRVFNASMFLRHLRGEGFRCFREQIVVADVCANYTTLNFDVDRSEPGQPDDTIQQLTYFATPEGKYAKGDGGRGVFTNIVLTVLNGFNSWPQFRAFGDCIEREFRAVGETPFRIAILNDATHEAVERTVGSIPADSSPHFKSVSSLLTPLALPDSVYRRHYLRTAKNLGEPKLMLAQGLLGMIKELASMRDGELHGGIPFGLIQFLVRLCQEEGIAETIDAWLDEHAANQGNDRSNVHEIMKAEDSEKLLIIEVRNDDEGRISHFEPYLRTQNLRVVEDSRLVPQKVRDWPDFESKLAGLIKSLREPPSILRFQIHFLVDPPLFNMAFHMISTSGGTSLGEEYVVLLRSRDRIRCAPAFVRDNWTKYAEELRRTALDDLKLVAIPPPAPGATLPNEKGLCYANFVLPSTSAIGCRNEKLLVGKLMRVGVPYMYWLHSEPSDGGLARVGEILAAWLKELKTLDGFPETFTTKRNGNEFALHASLFWDDPQFNPFSVTTGVHGK